MSSPGQGVLRLVRGGVLAGFCAALSFVAHLAGGGGVHISPDPVLAALVLAALCVAAADARRGFGAVFAVVAVSQIVFHLLAGVAAHPHAAAAGAGLDAAMICSHAVGAVVGSAALAYGERLLWSLAGLLGVRRAALLMLRPAPPAPRPVSVPAGGDRPRCRLAAFPRHGPAWRGPPVPVS